MIRILLVKLYFQSLEAKRPTTRKDFLDALAELAHGFNGIRDTYITMWAQILQQGAREVEMAKNVFIWVSYSTRLLSIQELQHALAAENPAFAAAGEDALSDQSSITEPCLGLINFSEHGIVEFMHPTAWETFPDYLKDKLTQAQSKMCRTCLTYLSFNDLGPCNFDEQIERCLHQFPLLSYAATEWAWHASQSEDRFKRRELLTWLSFTEYVERAGRIAVFLRPDYRPHIPSLPRDMVALHLTAYFGLHDVVAVLLWRGGKPGDLIGDCWTGMWRLAALLGLLDVIRTLLARHLTPSAIAVCLL